MLLKRHIFQMMRIDQFGHNIQFYLMIMHLNLELSLWMTKQGIPTALYYPKPLHQVDLYADNKIKLPVTKILQKSFEPANACISF